MHQNGFIKLKTETIRQVSNSFIVATTFGIRAVTQVYFWAFLHINVGSKWIAYLFESL